MPKQIIIAEQHRIAAVFSEDQIQELVVATGNHQVGDVYLGSVENVLPGIDAAFVNIGDSARNGFIHVTDLGPLRLKRSAGGITELLTPQQKVLVQVMKEPTGNKGPRLTGNVTLPGRYVVLMPYGRGVNLSRRIKSEPERNRLRALAVLIKPAGMGLLIRTEAEGKAEEAIIEDLETLQKQWELVQQEANSTRAPALLNRDDDFIQRVLRDMYSADVNRIVVDSNTGVKRVKQHLLSWSGGKAPEGVLIDHHRERLPVLDYFRVNAAIREALKPRVDLPSGGYIIIQPTEALTVIDVNSGSFTRSATARETVLWTNCEAATEIARQLRLRNVAGVIIVDFIDMDSHKDQLQVLEHFNKQLREDKARPQIAQLSELGLVELTRKRMGQNIYELFGHTCATCGGLGHLVRLPGETTRNGEIAEPGVPVPVIPISSREVNRDVNREVNRDVRTIPYPNTPSVREVFPLENWQERNELSDFDSSEDEAELDLFNHPSYQEQGVIPNNRRKRRRKIDDLPLRDELPKSNIRIPSRPSTFNEFKRELPLESEEQGNLEQYRHVVPEIERVEKPQRPRPSRQETEPPEIISIEMTPEEQDVYALMGVSPLIRVNRQIKNPKSVIIALVPPGESNTTETQTELSLDFPTETAVETATIESATTEQPTALEQPPAIEQPTVIEQPTAIASNTAEPDATQIPDKQPLIVSDVADSDTTINRRRRRRSSAIASETSFASES
ncbi:MAG TPA: Rne/Rng family ribonuclease [Oculatellaceae cyanobacterium]